ncbi:hypothetical protein V1514DRAFT_321022 [Lipomyces japonicus]|uniref:uncharacterized protein n=1 Tax=Lipomyces japonicus TaxID=56871 RepID=UPI0034CD7893
MEEGTRRSARNRDRNNSSRPIYVQSSSSSSLSPSRSSHSSSEVEDADIVFEDDDEIEFEGHVNEDEDRESRLSDDAPAVDTKAHGQPQQSDSLDQSFLLNDDGDDYGGFLPDDDNDDDDDGGGGFVPEDDDDDDDDYKDDQVEYYVQQSKSTSQSSKSILNLASINTSMPTQPLSTAEMMPSFGLSETELREITDVLNISSTANSKTIATDMIEDVLIALGFDDPPAAEINDIAATVDPARSGAANKELLIEILAFKYQQRRQDHEHDTGITTTSLPATRHLPEYEHAFNLFLDVSGKPKDNYDSGQVITLDMLKQIATMANDDAVMADEELLADMMRVACGDPNGPVGFDQFVTVMKSAGI